MDRYSKIIFTLIAALLTVIVLSLTGIIPQPAPTPAARAESNRVQMSVNDATNRCYVLKGNFFYVYDLDWPTEQQVNLTLRSVKPLPDSSQLKPYATETSEPAKPLEPKKKLASPALQTLLESLPANSQPRPGEVEGLIERNVANSWLAAKLKGKSLPVEITANVSSVNVGQNAYRSDNALEGLMLFGDARALGFVGTARIGGTDWSVILPDIHWNELDVDAAKRLRDLKDKDVTVKGNCKRLEFSYQMDRPVLRVYLEEITVDAVSPQLKAYQDYR